MADKTTLFTTDAGKEINTFQSLEPRLEQAVALGGSTVTESEHSRVLARDKDGNLVANPILTDILNTEFKNVVRRDSDGNSENSLWVTFATTSNAENGGVEPERSLFVSLNDLIVNVNVPATVTSVTTEPTTEEQPNPDYDPEDPDSPETITVDIDVPFKYYGKQIKLDAPEEQTTLWKLVSERTIRLHKNNGQSVSGTWKLDLERINRRTPDVLHLHVTEDTEQLAIDLDPSRTQTIPVVFTPDDGQDEFKLLLFIEPFDQRPEQKQFKLSNSTTEPAEAQFLRPWVIVGAPVDNTVLTGAKGEGGLLKVDGLTNCVKAVDTKDGSEVTVTVTVEPTHAGFNTTGTLDAVKLPSVPAQFDSTSQLKNLIDNGLFTVKANVTADGYEAQEIELSVCVNAADARPNHLTLVVNHEALSLERELVNGTAIAGQVACTSRHGESDKVVDSTLTVSGITGKDGTDTKTVTTTIVNKLGAEEKVINVEANDNGTVKGHIFVKCESDGYVTETIKLPVALKDSRLPDGNALWTITWTTKPSVTIPATQEGAKGDPLEAVVSSLGLTDALVATVGEIEDDKITNQWGNEETVDTIVVGVVTTKQDLSSKTSDTVKLPQDAFEEEVGCWLNVTILTKSGLLIVKKVQATVTDSRS